MLPLSLIIVDKAIFYSLGAGVVNQLSKFDHFWGRRMSNNNLSNLGCPLLIHFFHILQTVSLEGRLSCTACHHSRDKSFA